jgi:hypothetical protein
MMESVEARFYDVVDFVAARAQAIHRDQQALEDFAKPLNSCHLFPPALGADGATTLI